MSRPHLTLTNLPLPPSTLPTPSLDYFVHVISNLLTPQECSLIINGHRNLIPSNVTPTTVRDREQFDDETLAELLWSRLEQLYGNDRIQDEDGMWWKAKGLNSRFRLCRYLPGGKFSPHQDGRRLASVGEQSFMTVNSESFPGQSIISFITLMCSPLGRLPLDITLK